MPLPGAERLDRSRRVLDPEERVAEVLFGLIMVVTFTGSLSVAEAGRGDVRTMIIGAFGCNLAWGVIDGVLYLMGCLADRGRRVQSLRALKLAGEGHAAERILLDALPPLVASVLEPAEVTSLCERLAKMPDPPAVARLERNDALGALGVFLLVFLSTFPVAVPFVLVPDIPLAMRLSNAVALVMLFVTGVVYGRIVGRPPFRFGIGMVALGLSLVGLTIALGG
jgi:VIT1/CCC1 family predicted Fe2+/Mn2+ transporter